MSLGCRAHPLTLLTASNQFVGFSQVDGVRRYEYPDAGIALTGHPGGSGSPPGRPDLRFLVEQKAAEDGIDLDQAIWAVARLLVLGRAKPRSRLRHQNIVEG